MGALWGYDSDRVMRLAARLTEVTASVVARGMLEEDTTVSSGEALNAAFSDHPGLNAWIARPLEKMREPTQRRHSRPAIPSTPSSGLVLVSSTPTG